MATIESMISRRFNGQHGQAYLFDTVFNVVEASPEDRQMTTGLHRVRDISCKKCGQVMGWKYDRAYEQSQKYKEGKSILEKALLVEAAPPSPPDESMTPSTNNSTHNSASPSSTRATQTHDVIANMFAGGELIRAFSPTIGPRMQLINVDTSTFTASSDPSNTMASTYSASPGTRSRRAADDPSFRSGSSVSIRSSTNSEASEDSELA